MIRSLAGLAVVFPILTLPASTAEVELPQVIVTTPQVSNQQPVGAFAMPVSALRYEPRVDLQGRNLAESQADVAIRGGTFENTGFQVGALSLFDPQTGHYAAEIPLAPLLLSAPDVLVGAGHAQRASNATAGMIAYGFRPIHTAGLAVLGGGEYGTHVEEFYQGYRSLAGGSGSSAGVDVDFANSGANGSVPFGESRFTRANVRFQLSSENAQTDLVYAYQEKFFGWPNLYTPFNSNETENLQTALLALNHLLRLNHGGWIEAGAYWRRNKDDYAFNRFAPVGPVHPFQHTTRVLGAATNGRLPVGDGLAFVFKAAALHDDLRSTSLTAGRYHTRTFTTAGVYPEKTWQLANNDAIVATAGAGYDDTNRDGSAVSPVFSIAHENHGGASLWPRQYLSYAKTTQEPTYTALNSSATAGLFRGNPNLARSASHNLELGTSFNWAGWEGSAAAFYRRDLRLVDWTFRQGVTARSANAVDIDTAGAEVFVRRTFGAVDLAFGYTELTKDADYGSSTVDASFYALNFPKHRLTAAITARLGAGWELRMDNDVRVQQDNVLRTMGGDRPVLSTLGMYFRPRFMRGLTLAAEVANLWDSRFQTVPAVPAARRQTVGTVSYSW